MDDTDRTDILITAHPDFFFPLIGLYLHLLIAAVNHLLTSPCFLLLQYTHDTISFKE